MNEFSLTCLGVGDGWSCADRNHASFLYRLGDATVLLDCGEPVDRSLTALGLKYDTLDAIFLSHLHSDHIGGLYMLMQGLWLQGRKRDLPIFMPGGAIKPLKAMFNATLLFDELLRFKRKFVPLKAGKANAIQRVRVTPFASSHLERLRAQFQSKHRVDFSAFCFLIEAGKRRVGHSADLGKPEDLEPILARPLDLLVCELSHVAPERMFSYLHGRKIKKIAFVHLAQGQWVNLPKLRRLAKKMLPDIPHRFAMDGETFSF